VIFRTTRFQIRSYSVWCRVFWYRGNAVSEKLVTYNFRVRKWKIFFFCKVGCRSAWYYLLHSLFGVISWCLNFVPTFRNTLFHFRRWCLPMKMKQTYRCLNLMFRRFGTLCSIFVVGVSRKVHTPPVKMEQKGRFERLHIKFRHRGFTPK
jgi:hypothetical protein